MKNQTITALLYTVITAIVLGIGYPLAITAVAHVIFPRQAAGSLLYNPQHELIGSRLLGQPFTGPTWFHSRPSAAGTGYDATSSGGSNLGPTSKALADRIAAQTEGPGAPIDLVTTSASGLDPDISPAAADFQVPRLAAQRHLSESALRSLIAAHTSPRQLGFLGEPRVNVLALNRALDAASPAQPN